MTPYDQYMLNLLAQRSAPPGGTTAPSPELDAAQAPKAKDPTFVATFCGIDIYQSPTRYVCGDWHWPRKGSAK